MNSQLVLPASKNAFERRRTNLFSLPLIPRLSNAEDHNLSLLLLLLLLLLDKEKKPPSSIARSWGTWLCLSLKAWNLFSFC